MPPADPNITTRLSPTDSAFGYLTADLPGIGGVVKQCPEDFEVEEIPAYEPSGDGEHLFLWVEKRDVAAEQLTRHIGRVLGVSTSDIGVAGLKDRRAVTRQYVSVPARCAARISEIDTDGIRVLRSALHGNKLRSGHVKGNRFSILVREIVDDALQRAVGIAARIVESGFPNSFGEQRFGVDGKTAQMGFQLLRGEIQPRDIPGSRRRFLLRMSLSAAQSVLFNRALAARLSDGLLHRVLPGDVMQVVQSGGPFVAEDVETEQQRFDNRETVISGPMFGIKMKTPTGVAAERESRLLAEVDLTPADFRNFKKLVPGTRRPYLIWPQELSIEPESNALRFRFTLPSGVYATVLLREFLKTNDQRSKQLADEPMRNATV